MHSPKQWIVFVDLSGKMIGVGVLFAVLAIIAINNIVQTSSSSSSPFSLMARGTKHLRCITATHHAELWARAPKQNPTKISSFKKLETKICTFLPQRFINSQDSKLPSHISSIPSSASLRQSYTFDMDKSFALHFLPPATRSPDGVCFYCLVRLHYSYLAICSLIVWYRKIKLLLLRQKDD